jgi:hypothetical protein
MKIMTATINVSGSRPLVVEDKHAGECDSGQQSSNV